MKNIIFLAPPAAGKGTCSDLLKENYDYEHISTGAILRNEIACQSSLGKEIADIMASGKLVSDEIMINLINNKLSTLNKNFILDGFPRTLNQAEKLNDLFTKLKIDNYVVIFLDIDKDLAKKRTLGRITCDTCGKSYNIYFDNFKPKKDNICDNCGSVLSKRKDDNEESFNTRFDTYIKNTLPILEYYKNKNKVVSVEVTNDFQKLANLLKEIIISND